MTEQPEVAPLVPANFRAQFATILKTSEYNRVVGIIESWPGVAAVPMGGPLSAEERAAVYDAANRGPASDEFARG